MVALLWLLALSAGQACARTYTVAIEGVRFVPTSLKVQTGDIIIWKNKDPFPHTVTAIDGQFDSGEMAAGGEWRFRARQPGEFRYYCALHPTMKASLTVENMPARESH